MGQELLEVNTSWTRTPRTYYHAVASNGAQALRGSHDDRYTHAVVMVKVDYPNQLSWATFHGSEQLAKRQITNNRNWQKKSIEQGSTYGTDREWEVVKLEKITAKEFRAIKSADLKANKDHVKKVIQQHTGLFVEEEGELQNV